MHNPARFTEEDPELACQHVKKSRQVSEEKLCTAIEGNQMH